MPLVPAKLIKGITDAFNSVRENSESNVDAAEKVAAAYADYASSAMAGPGAKPIFTGAEKQVMKASLIPAFLQPNFPPVVAAVIMNSILTYWTVPPVQFAIGPIAGMASVVPGAIAMIPAMVAVLSNVMNTVDSCCMQMGTIMDAATRTCIVIFTLPVPPLGPPPPSPLL